MILADPFAHQMQTLQQELKEVQEELHQLAQTYREELSLSLVDFIVEQVYQICTVRFPEDFLRLDPLLQTRLLQVTHRLSKGLGTEVQRLVWHGALSYQELEQLLAPYLSATERQLNQLLGLDHIGSKPTESNSPGSSSGPLVLKLIEAELRNPTVKQAKARIQVLGARILRIQRQIKDVEQKASVALAKSRWHDLTASLTQGSESEE